LCGTDIDFEVGTANGYDSIFTITDHDCTKAVILLPCREEMNSLEFTKLYLRHVFPFVAIPSRVISDPDPKFTSKVFREICNLLKVKQNISSAYHPQTDGQSEKTNQHVETALRIFGNFQQMIGATYYQSYNINSRTYEHPTRRNKLLGRGTGPGLIFPLSQYCPRCGLLCLRYARSS
jgi:hypothetical protein